MNNKVTEINNVINVDTEVKQEQTVNVEDNASSMPRTKDTPLVMDTKMTSDRMDVAYLSSFKREIYKHIDEAYEFRDTRSYSRLNLKEGAERLLDRGVPLNTATVGWLNSLVKYIEDKDEWLVYDNTTGIWKTTEKGEQLNALLVDFFQALHDKADMTGDGIYKLYASEMLKGPAIRALINNLKSGNAFRIPTAQTIINSNENIRYFKTVDGKRVILHMDKDDMVLEPVRFKDTQDMMLQSMARIAIDPMYDPDDEDDPKIWTDLLKQYMMNDPVKYEYFCKVLAYMMSPYNYNQVLIYWIGKEGRNGKSTVIKVLQDILGPYATRLNSDLINAHPSISFKKDDALAATSGKSLLIFNEIDERMVASTQNIKDLTEGGRDEYGNKVMTTIRPAYKANYDINICGTPVVIANTLINMGEWTNLRPIFRRLILVPFDYVIPHEDPDLLNKLAKEYPKIERWLYMNYFKYKGVRLKDLPVPQDWQDVFNQYYKDSDIIKAFWEECFEVTMNPRDRIKRADLYKFYQKYCNANGRKAIRNTGSNGFTTLIATVIKACGLDPKPVNISGTEYIRGLVIKQNYEDMVAFAPDIKTSTRTADDDGDE